MPPRRSGRTSTLPSKSSSSRRPPPPLDEEVFQVHSVEDSSDDDDVNHPSSRPPPARASRQVPSRTKPAPEPTAKVASSRRKPHPKSDVIGLDISDSASPAGPVEAAAAPHHEADDDHDMLQFEDVDVAAPQNGQGHKAGGDQDDDGSDLEMEDVDLELSPQQPGTPSSEDGLRDMYAAAYQEALHRNAGSGSGSPDDDDDDGDEDGEGGGGGTDSSKLPIFKDGKGQHRGVEISMGTKGKKQDEKSEAVKKRAETMPTARDRQGRINAHKLYVLSILAFARIRNKWCNDETLRDHLAQMVPDFMVTKLKAIHPKKVPQQRERVRMFESFITELAKWWARCFRLDPKMTAKAALRQPNQDIATGILPVPGRKIDGWIAESAADREKRHRKERQERIKKEADDANAAFSAAKSKGKGKAKANARGTANGIEAAASAGGKRGPNHKPMEITLFMPGTAIRPVFLSLLPPVEAIGSPADLLARVEARSGSRETSAQLFCALCRSLGIPARLVVSVQPTPWSVGASKLANTTSPTPKGNKGKAKAKSKLPSKTTRFNTKPDDDFTSDDEDFDDAHSVRSARSAASTPRSRGSRSSRAATVSSDSSLSDLSGIEEVESPRNRAARANQRAERDTENLARKAVLTAIKSPAGKRDARAAVDEATVDEGASSDRSAASASKGRQVKAKGKSNAKAPAAENEGEGEEAGADGDYRPAKWRNLDTPLKVEPKAKLRRNKPKALKPTEVAPEDDSDVEPVDLQSPPTVWVEVFSKPFQKWITIDPVRSVVRASGNRWMEPSPTDRQNKLVYVVAVEEDGYARDVTSRYTNKFNSRVARLRPLSRSKNEEDWWAKTARAIHRPQRLNRDAMEDIELNESASKEAMPTSVAGYKDHPVYFLEKHLKRDEVVHPRNRIATFQGMDVYKRSNVLTLRSSRQWFNEGRVVKDNEVALKWVKSRGYTLANKRAEEQAKAEGREAPNEGLYAEFQTQLYTPPPIVDGVIPTNSFGNIDLFVPSMLPKGAAHIPFNGVTKVVKKMGISYAEAITGFEFRKHRGMPKITGVVVPAEHEQAVLDAYWEHEHLAAKRESTKRQERAIKAWKKLLNALRIAKRVKEQYGDGSKVVDAEAASPLVEAGGGGGGFLVEGQEEEAEAVQKLASPPRPPSETQLPRAKGREDEEMQDATTIVRHSPSTPPAPKTTQDDPNVPDSATTPRRTGPIVSLHSLIEAESAPTSSSTTFSSKKGKTIKLVAKTGTKRQRRTASIDEEEGTPPPPPKRQQQQQQRQGSRRSSRRSAVAAVGARKGGYAEMRSDEDEEEE